MRQKSNILIILTVLLVVILGSVYAYSMYASSALVPGDVKVATWSILVNDCNIVDPSKNVDKEGKVCFASHPKTLEDGTTIIEIEKNFVVTSNDIYYYPLGNESAMMNNKIAPGTEARFRITIDAGETEAAFKYNLKASYPGDNAQIKFYVIESYVEEIDGEQQWFPLEDEFGEIKETELTDSGFESMIYYSEEEANSVHYLQIKVVWLNDDSGANDEKDTNIATCKDADNEEDTCETAPLLKIPVSITFEQITSESQISGEPQTAGETQNSD